MRRLLILVGCLVSAATVAACAGDDASATADAPAKTEAPAYRGVIDSALPIDTLLRRFRATIPDTPTVLTGGATTPEALARALLSALAAGDTAKVRSLVLSRAEFAWLHYPHTKWTKPPYEMGPELVWLQISAASEKGLVRLIRRYGGSPLRFEALLCPDGTERDGPNTVATGCQVRFAAADSAARELRLFGSLLNRGGRYKFISYANDL